MHHCGLSLIYAHARIIDRKLLQVKCINIDALLRTADMVVTYRCEYQCSDFWIYDDLLQVPQFLSFVTASDQ
jgi:hypothetical protein